jgi:hypothetical protein
MGTKSNQSWGHRDTSVGGKISLPIDVVPGTNPPRFRWRLTVDTIAGSRTIDQEALLPSQVEKQIVALIKLVREMESQCTKLQAFKDWVHKYLDAHGIPHHPPGMHGAEGCRIGDRMDWLLEKAGLKMKQSAPTSTLRRSK